MNLKDTISFVFMVLGVAIGPFSFWHGIELAIVATILFLIGISIHFYGKEEKEQKIEDGIIPEIHLNKKAKRLEETDIDAQDYDDFGF